MGLMLEVIIRSSPLQCFSSLTSCSFATMIKPWRVEGFAPAILTECVFINAGIEPVGYQRLHISLRLISPANMRCVLVFAVAQHVNA